VQMLGFVPIVASEDIDLVGVGDIRQCVFYDSCQLDVRVGNQGVEVYPP
jgi:hypothetical protein